MRIIEDTNINQNENRTDPKDLKIFELQSEVESLRQENKRLRCEAELVREGNRRILTREIKADEDREKLRISISVERKRNSLLEQQIRAGKKRQHNTVTQKNEEILSLRKSSHSAMRSTLSILRSDICQFREMGNNNKITIIIIPAMP